MIKAIFYSKFDTQEGPKVVHQVPDGAIVPSATASPQTSPFFTFSDISFFVIPRQELCGNLLQVCTGGYRILGYPICRKSPCYDRNEFIFNFCLVLNEDENFAIYKSVVQKLADLMHGLEEQSGFLSRDNSKSGEGKVYSLCETLMEDLNNYCECMIPIDDLNTLNIKLFPIYPAPPPVRAWQVPLFTIRYETFMDENWDLTMQKIVPYINGINSVRIISTLADVDFSLTCRAIKHLIYYGCVFLLDIFSFSAIYAPTAQFSSTIACDEGMQRECARYVNTRFAPTPMNMAPPSSRGESSNPGGYRYDRDGIWPLMDDDISESSGKVSSTNGQNIVDGVGIVELYAGLKQGQSVRQWYTLHSQQLTNIDIRRFITFGIIKGFLYRVHKYAYATGLPTPSTSTPHNLTGATPSISSIRGSLASSHTSAGDALAALPSSDHLGVDDHNDDHNLTSFRNGDSRPGSRMATPPDDEDEDFIDDKTLSKYLDGVHCFDQVCTELEISERELTARLKQYHCEVQIIHR
ncbi:Nitrogen permease regulator 2 [Elaphomyces granulatus]